MMTRIIAGTEKRIKINKETILELDYALQTERNTHVQSLIVNEMSMLRNWNKLMIEMYNIK